MTSIVWDGKSLAGDGRLTVNGYIVDSYFSKVRKINANLRGERVIAIGLSGDADAHHYIESWIKNDCLDDLPDCMEIGGIIVTESKAYSFCDDSNGRLCLINDSFAVGSGAPLCLSALKLGLNAKEAVKHAASIDVYTGGRVRSICCRE
ncbi:hypothetical protein [Aliikangiella coralliicola]|uniref:Proteasome subunit beta n=1 Tax=Aliikangiella coralliicola TaxID=2592383 RepID=A0A545U063_9GAMM|nr:hypothetical protein [Aliikangiella coralliicola]TQV82851.1 hypothetical protein FLL46_24080 [Aliikangiella coralliicola]